NALESGRVAHAYLFTGARGVGKTSTARILAKALNCEKGPTATPCDACDVCRAVASGEAGAALEIHAPRHPRLPTLPPTRSPAGPCSGATPPRNPPCSARRRPTPC